VEKLLKTIEKEKNFNKASAKRKLEQLRNQLLREEAKNVLKPMESVNQQRKTKETAEIPQSEWRDPGIDAARNPSPASRRGGCTQGSQVEIEGQSRVKGSYASWGQAGGEVAH
jgi:hypothetical protein